MKTLDVSAITGSTRMPIKKGTLKFLQDAHKENIATLIEALIRSVYGNYSSSTPYVLYGCKSSSGGGNTTITRGAIFLNGEVYEIPVQTFPDPSGPNVILVNLSTTQYTTDADPVTFTDSVARNVHNIRKGNYSTGTSGSGTLCNYNSFQFPFEQPVESRTAFNGDTIDFTQTKTIIYDPAVSATATPTVALNLVNGISGNKVRCIFAPDNSMSIALTAITETGSAEVIDKVQNMLPTVYCALCWVEYEFIGGTYVVRTISGFNP